MRTRRVSACRGDVSTHELMYEDGAASHALQDDDTGPVVTNLCATCGAEYANRVATVGCTVCSSRLALNLTAEYDPEFGGYCGGCAVEAATGGWLLHSPIFSSRNRRRRRIRTLPRKGLPAPLAPPRGANWSPTLLPSGLPSRPSPRLEVRARSCRRAPSKPFCELDCVSGMDAQRAPTELARECRCVGGVRAGPSTMP